MFSFHLRPASMALKILSDGPAGLAVFYDSVTMVAFGPVMDDPVWAGEFAEWLRSRGRGADLRDDPELVDLWGTFQSGYTLCEECGTTATPKGHPVCSVCRGGGGAMSSNARKTARRIAKGDGLYFDDGTPRGVDTTAFEGLIGVAEWALDNGADPAVKALVGAARRELRKLRQATRQSSSGHCV